MYIIYNYVCIYIYICKNAYIKYWRTYVQILLYFTPILTVVCTMYKYTVVMHKRLPFLDTLQQIIFLVGERR